MNNDSTIGYETTVANFIVIKDITDIFITSCAPFTIGFNVLVLYVAMKYVNFKKRLEQCFVVSITSADLIFGLVYMTTVRISWTIPWFLCRPYYIVVSATSISSVVFLLLLNVHKLITLTLPFRSLTFLTRRKIYTEIFLCWVLITAVSVIFSVEPMFHLEAADYPDYPCKPYIEPNYYSIRLVIFYITPSVLSLLISICIFVVAQKNSRHSSNWLRRILFVFSATIWMALTVLPYRVSYLITQLCTLMITYQYDNEVSDEFWDYDNSTEPATTYNSGTTCFYPILQYSLICWLTLGSVINPLITIITQQKYRQGVAKLFKRYLLKRDSVISNKSRQTSISRTYYSNYNHNNNDTTSIHKSPTTMERPNDDDEAEPVQL